MATTQTAQPHQTSLRGLETPRTLAQDLAIATFWRAAIWCLACTFSERRCDITRSVASLDEHDVIKTVSLDISFKDRSIAEFADFLRERIGSLGDNFQTVKVLLGTNDNSPGLITIDGGAVQFEPGKHIPSLPRSTALTYGRQSHERKAISTWDERVWHYLTNT